ncbi:MAG: hypothetical protein ACRCXZ_09935 [Patescibacteria group bacterium]
MVSKNEELSKAINELPSDFDNLKNIDHSKIDLSNVEKYDLTKAVKTLKNEIARRF